MGMLWHWSHKNLLLGRPLCFSTRSWAIGAWGGGGGSMLLFRLHGGNVFARLGRGAAELHTCSFLTAKYKAMGTAKPQKAISSVRRAVNLKRRW